MTTAGMAAAMPSRETVQSVQAQTGRVGVMMLATMVGGTFIVASFLTGIFFDESLRDSTGTLRNPHSDVIALIGAVLLGLPLVWQSLVHLYRGESHMDELVALAVIAAIALEEYQMAGIVAFFMIIANLVETRTALGARAAIAELIRLTPQEAHRVLADGGEEIVAASALRPGDVIRVRPGDNIAADGAVIRGESSVNQANVTGESLAVDKGVGAEVYGGTNNLTGALDVRVTKVGAETALGRVQSLILEAERTKIPLMRLIDRYAGWYTPTVVMLAAVVWFFAEDKSEGMKKAIAMLVAGCPCALVLATPTAIVAALSCAARLGILIKNVINLESARSLTAIVFDKTGTLTTGELSVTQMRPAPGVDGAELLRAAASAEQLSKHPAARALVSIARQAKIELSDPTDFEETMGRGVRATVEGGSVMVGRSAWLAEKGADMSLLSDPDYQDAEGLSMLYVTRGGRCIGWIGLEDKTRPEARSAIDALRELGIKTLTMVTGDKWSVAKRVAAEMGCTDVHAEVLPEDKLRLVDELKKRGHCVCVIGDGVNDAPALAAGHLGVAMGAAGSDVAINSASIALMNNDLSRIPFLIKLSRGATRVISQNLVFGVLFILVVMPLAVSGALTAVPAAFLHTIASAVVIFNSARLVRFGEELAPHNEVAEAWTYQPPETMPIPEAATA
ncbi:MAG: cadmium-translocating P-type ATPase [Phycisphaerales bacterium]|nr:cadmium-translocating P-type ATPase [Phycisphaerales bacterium]